MYCRKCYYAMRGGFFPERSLSHRTKVNATLQSGDPSDADSQKETPEKGILHSVAAVAVFMTGTPLK